MGIRGSSGGGGSSIVDFEGSSELSSPANSLSLTLADSAKERYEIEIVGQYDSTTSRATHFTINNKTSSIYDYQHNRYFSGASNSSAQSQDDTEGYIDNNGAVGDGDVLMYTLVCVRVVGGWMVTSIGTRNIASLSNVSSLSSCFVSDDNPLSSVQVFFSTGNFKTCKIKAWGFGES